MKTRNVTLVLVGLLFFSRVVSAAQEFFPFVGEITADNVNIRAGQSVNFEKLGQLNAGDIVIVRDRSYSWYKIELPATAASYIVSKYVRREGTHRGTVTADRVNLRAGPGIEHSIIGQVQKGDTVSIQKIVNDWYEIEPLESIHGWISEDLLTFKSHDLSLVRQKREPPEEKAAPAKEKAPEKKGGEKKLSVSLEGELKIREKGAAPPDTRYKLVTDDDKTYFLKGYKFLLDDFLGQRVTVKGALEELPENPSVKSISAIEVKLVL